MRTVGLLALAILFPVFVHAADSTWLKTYIISNNTICPSAPGVCPVSTSIDIEFYNPVKNASIYIGTSDSPILIYKNISGVTNPKAYPWNGTVDNKNGVIMSDGIYTVLVSATLADGSEVKDTSRTIAVSSTVGANNNDASTTDSSTQEQTTSISSGSAATYTPPPSALTVDAGSASQDANMNVPLYLSARATAKGGAIDSSAQIVWGFGDGSSASASSVKKTYYYAGTYLVVVTATDGLATGRDELTVTVRPAQVRVLEVPNAGIMISNDASERLDISEWALFSNKKSFRIPSGTVILPKSNIVLPLIVTHLPSAPEVTLAYPDGTIAARYIQPLPVVKEVTQLSVASTSSNVVQKVEPIISQKTPVQKNENAVSAPTAATELAAVGAALPASPPKKPSPVENLLKSPWTLGFIGTVILAGGAFILL